MGFNLTRYEREVTINFNEEEGVAIVDTRSTIWRRKLEKLRERFPDLIRIREQDEYGAIYIVPKCFISIRPSRKIKPQNP